MKKGTKSGDTIVGTFFDGGKKKKTRNSLEQKVGTGKRDLFSARRKGGSLLFPTNSR